MHVYEASNNSQLIKASKQLTHVEHAACRSTIFSQVVRSDSSFSYIFMPHTHPLQYTGEEPVCMETWSFTAKTSLRTRVCHSQAGPAPLQRGRDRETWNTLVVHFATIVATQSDCSEALRGQWILLASRSKMANIWRKGLEHQIW